MPGYVLHLVAARMFLDRLPVDHPFCKNKGLRNDFYIGNLLPDTVRDKSHSHFRDYIPQVFAFYDSGGRITDKREEIARVFLKKRCESITNVD